MPSPDSPEVLERFHNELSLVDIIAKQVLRTVQGRAELDDLLSAGREGLLDAARRFDPTLGVPFRAYANFRVRGAIIDGMRKMAALPRSAYQRLAALRDAGLVSEGNLEWTFREPVGSMSPGEAEAALDEHLAAVVTAAAIGLVSEAVRTEAVADFDLEASYEREELLSLVRKELADLEHEEAEIVRRHYFDGHRLEDIARDLDMSKSWASRLHTRAMARLTTRLSAAASPA